MNQGTDVYPRYKPVGDWDQNSWDFSGNMEKTKKRTRF